MGFEMPKPNETHARLAMLAGVWEGVETLFPSDWDPQGGEATASMKSRVALGGFAVIGDYEQRRGGAVTFQGHAVWTIDPASGEVLLTWFDTIGGLPETFRGKFEGNQVVVTSRTHQGLNRLSYALEGANAMTSRMELSGDGAAWKPLFEGKYARK